MAKYEHQDRYYRKAKELGLPSRASFKIEEMIAKHKVVKAGDWVLDLGAAPGGWTVILAKAVGAKGRVLALDLQNLAKRAGGIIEFLQADIYGEEAKAWLAEKLGERRLDAICSDMSPKLTGIPFKDAYLSHELVAKAADLAERWLKPGGSFVAKQFPGSESAGDLKRLRSMFKTVKVFEPESSRKTSKEVYLLGIGFQASSS
ncbi:MAG TPA: RlmE family RNA methyltransferase [bacterium]|nr:RlmE family RNA methyltransferase [bacterium]